LLPETQRERFDVVLVRPRNPLNIGAAARAMANFGFSRLSVVAPFEATWREARSAVDALDVLLNAREAATVGEAVKGATLVAGTGSLTYRKPEQRVVRLAELPELVSREMGRGGRVALVFGPEKHGLTRDDLSWCHVLVEIPTDARQPSMNLGQAVAVCLYELAARVGAAGVVSGPEPVESGRLELLAGVVEEAMEAAGYRAGAMREGERRELRLMLRRMTLTAHDTRRILGIFRRILWRLGQGPGAGRG
jgi:tRNA/rRNA methyltransferase